MPNSSIVKKTALTALKGKYLKYSFCCFAVILIFLICSLISQGIGIVLGDIGYYAVLFLFGFFVLSPISLGLIRIFRRLLWGVSDKPIMIFHYFTDIEKYKRALNFTLGFLLRMLGRGLIAFMPAGIITALANHRFYETIGVTIPLWSSGLWPVKAVVWIVCFAVFFIITVKYYLAPFLFVADEDMYIGEVFHMSCVISKKSAIDYFLLIGSLALPIIISVLIAPLIFTLPYLICCYLVHSRFSVAGYNMFVKKISDEENNVFYAE